MKVLVISNSDIEGGAAIAAKRLTQSLLRSRIEVKLLVNIKKGNEEFVFEVARTKFQKRISTFRKYLEKVLFLRHEVSKNERFSFSTANFGQDLSNHPLVLQADVLHIHWINHSFLSYENLEKLFKLKKAVFITMHDMWYMTGGCHHARECMNYQFECGNCVFLKNSGMKDLSHNGFLKKQSVYTADINFVACSDWLLNLGKKSNLLKNKKLYSIPNPIDISTFFKTDKKMGRKRFNLPTDKILILYTAAKVDNPRKGYKYFEEALHQLFNSIDFIKDTIEIVVMGWVKNPDEINFHFKTHFIGNLSNESDIATCYNAVDAFVTPSLEENLPNTIIESMACGTPSVAFNIGGIPQIIDHLENGYVAEYKNTEDLVSGIKWVLAQKQIAKKCIEKVKNQFSEDVVSQRFIQLYIKALEE